MIVYVKHQGARIVRKHRTLQVIKEGDVYQTVFVHRVKQLIIMGHVEITPPAMNVLFREKIDTVYLTLNGRYKGRLEMEESKNVFLTQRQFDSLHDEELCLSIAKSIVTGKLANMATLMGRIKRRSPKCDVKKFVDPIREVRELIPKIADADNVASLRGYEGRGTALFFQGFRMGFKQDWGFAKRIRRPPTDPVNAVLSFLYTLLFNRVYAALRAAGLNPSVGYLHGLDYGRYSLALDLMEEFRSIVVETCVLSLFNLKILKKDSFYREELPEAEPEVLLRPKVSQDTLGYIFENSDDGYFDAKEQKISDDPLPDHSPEEKRPCRLRPDALKAVLEAFEDKLTTEFSYFLTDQKITYQEAIFAQARQFREVLEKSRLLYRPLQLK